MIIKCKRCLKDWHIKIPIIELVECPNCCLDPLKADFQRKELGLRKVRSDKKPKLERRKINREKVRNWRINQKVNSAEK
jgi:hypothetical protein